MSNDGWGKGWPSNTHGELWPEVSNDQPKWEEKQPWPEAWVEPAEKFINSAIKYGGEALINMIDISTKPDITVIVGRMKDGQLIADYFTGEAAQTKIKEYENAVPTHDPYTNPDMHIYHECGCGAILDPNTKSFATLNTAASQVGWKIRWGVHTYQAYCRKCGEGVE